MAFEVSRTGYTQLDPTFSPGYPYPNKYHNIGQLQTPYEGKRFGTGGDYGPPQKTVYYTEYNRNYPYVMDADFRPVGYLPTEGCCFGHPGYSPCYEGQYPDRFVSPNYFAPRLQHPSGHAEPINKHRARINSGNVLAYEKPVEKEGYDRVSLGEHKGGYGSSRTTNYRRLRVAHKPLIGANHFYPKVLPQKYY